MSKRVLVIDDDPSLCDVLEAELAKRDFGDWHRASEDMTADAADTTASKSELLQDSFPTQPMEVFS